MAGRFSSHPQRTLRGNCGHSRIFCRPRTPRGRSSGAVMIPLLLLFLSSTPPLGLDLYRPVPEANPLTPEKVALGRRLFFDKQLSRDGTVACATCHNPRKAFTDGRPAAVGIDGQK